MIVREGREQELVQEFFRDTRSGFFVEVGANRPRQASQTWHLEQLGWTGILIEPQPDLAERLPRDVPIFLYHGRDDDSVPFAHVELYARMMPRAQVRRLAGRDHQLDNQLSEVALDIRQL